MGLVDSSIVEQRYQAVSVVKAGDRVEVAARVGVSRQSVHFLVSRDDETSLAGLQDRSRRPDSCPHQPRRRWNGIHAGMVDARRTLSVEVADHTIRVYDDAAGGASSGRCCTRRWTVNEQEIRALLSERLERLTPAAGDELRHPDYVLELPQRASTATTMRAFRPDQSRHPLVRQSP